MAEEKNAEGYLLVLLHNENVLPRIDALTDLYSHTRFDADVESEIEKQQPFAVLMIKLERFTNLNIIYGTEKLHAFEQRLREKLAEGIQVNNRRSGAGVEIWEKIF